MSLFTIEPCWFPESRKWSFEIIENEENRVIHRTAKYAVRAEAERAALAYVHELTHGGVRV